MPTFAKVQAEELKELEKLRERRGVKVPASRDRVGLAFSGGGIRSATINLGILQALARHGLLRRIDYLSTVSGGGFIGGWLERWIRERGIDHVEKHLGQRVEGQPEKTAPEPPPVNFLRDYSNYLTPRMGVLGPDTWAAIATYLRNVILNQAILVGFLGALLVAPWILGSFFDYGPGGFPPPLAVGIAGAVLIVMAVAGGVVNTSTCATGEDRGYTRQRDVVLMVVLPLFAGAFLFNYAIWRKPEIWTFLFCLLAGTAVYAVGHLCGWVISKVSFRKTPSAVPDFRNVLWALPSGAFAGVEVYGLRRLIHVWEANSLPGRWHAASWGAPLFVVAFLLAGTLHIGLAKFALRNEIQEWWARLGGLLMLWGLVWSVFFALAIYAPLGVTLLGKFLWTRRVLLWGWILHSGIGARLGWGTGTGGKGTSSTWKEVVAKAAPFVFVAGLLVLLACGVEQLAVHFSKLPADLPQGDIERYWVNADAIQAAFLWILLGAALGVMALLAWRVDINRFSMNLLYRNRLVRCYLGASNEQRKAQKFTGFDPNDDLPLALFGKPELEKGKNETERKLYSGPYPILNATLNVTHGERLAWQERKAESFVFTPLFCGYEFPEMKPSVNLVRSAEEKVETYLATEEWAFPAEGQNPGGPKLGLAISTSGAAVSPNMGFHTYPPLAFLMTMFNVRLGEWLANPRYARPQLRYQRTSPEGGPEFSLFYLLCELFGSTTDRSRYVYLSDGAHFENLGIYELVRRECDFILASDAGADPDYVFGDLVNAIRKCRADLGAEIRLNVDPLRPDPESRLSRTHAVRGEIRYRDGKVGQLLYFKSCLTGDEPNDVRDYQRQHPEFPQQSTGDQWFDESQFESYRMLGYRAAEAMILRPEQQPPSLEEVIAAAPES
jgi:hypothetical protein